MEPRVSFGMGKFRGWRLRSSAGVVLGDASINEFFYGVAPRYATSWRPAYAAKGGLMVARVGLSGSYDWDEDVRISAFVRMDSYRGAANHGSPLMQQSSGLSASAAFTWTLYRSIYKAQ